MGEFVYVIVNNAFLNGNFCSTCFIKRLYLSDFIWLDITWVWVVTSHCIFVCEKILPLFHQWNVCYSCLLYFYSSIFQTNVCWKRVEIVNATKFVGNWLVIHFEKTAFSYLKYQILSLFVLVFICFKRKITEPFFITCLVQLTNARFECSRGKGWCAGWRAKTGFLIHWCPWQGSSLEEG